MLNYETVFHVMNLQRVEWILIGGLNFFLRYQAVATRDIDLFVNWSLSRLESRSENKTQFTTELGELVAREEAKRQRHQTDSEKATHQDVLLQSLNDSAGYRAAGTPADRLRTQRELLRIHGRM